MTPNAITDELRATGDCFVATWNAAPLVLSDEVVICHGTPVWAGGDGTQRMWHAWIEARTPGGPWVVLDVAGQRAVTMKRANYYRAGRIDGDEHVWRWSLAEAAEAALAFGHYGPWVDGYEDIAL